VRVRFGRIRGGVCLEKKRIIKLNFHFLMFSYRVCYIFDNACSKGYNFRARNFLFFFLFVLYYFIDWLFFGHRYWRLSFVGGLFILLLEFFN